MLSNELLLLKIIDIKGRITLLIDRGLSPAQIAMLIQDQQDKGNIIIKDDSIELTNAGKRLLDDNLDKIFPSKKEQWILPQEHFYTKPLPPHKIVLPPKGKI